VAEPTPEALERGRELAAMAPRMEPQVEAAFARRIGEALDGFAARAVTDFTVAILHGDRRHRDWLVEAARAFNSGRPVPVPDAARPTPPPEPMPHEVRASAIARRIEVETDVDPAAMIGNALAAAATEAKRAAFDECARAAELYADENIRMAGDTILADPVLNGSDRSPAGFARSERLQIEGAVHAAQHHAGKYLAAVIRAVARKLSA
jgi:hypothetical protein